MLESTNKMILVQALLVWTWYNVWLNKEQSRTHACFCPPLWQKRGYIKSHSSVCLSLCPSICLFVGHKNFNLGHNFCTITDRALILGMCVPCDKTFPVVPCCDLDGDLWPTSRSICCRAGTTILWICLFLFTTDFKGYVSVQKIPVDITV